jgi:hypothetical protein
MELRDAMSELQQPRSRYQLEHFIIGQHDTPEMRFYQAVIELQDLLGKYKKAEINRRRLRYKIADLALSDDPMDGFDREDRIADLEMLERVMAGAEREIECLLAMYAEMEHFDRAAIDAAQPDYWEARLTRQTNLQIMAGGVQWSQLDAMRQIGLLDGLVAEREHAYSNGQKELRT